MALLSVPAIANLRTALSPESTINLPGDATFSTRRWARNAEKPAAVVVCPATPEDVVQALAFVQGKGAYSGQQKLDIAVKGGGHSPSGASSSDGGLVIDLQPNMHGVRVDPEAKLAYVKGGSIWAEVDEAAIKYGLATVAGTVNHTGVGGLTLGGGYGWLCGLHGLVIDNLVQATVVTASGNILTVSDRENQDLFWAIRGGGGNFGVVTEFVYRLHEQRPDLYALTLVYPPPLLESVVDEVNAWLLERSNRENALVACVHGPDGRPGILAQLTYNGDSEEGAKKYERFVKLGPVMNKAETVPYIKLNTILNDHVQHGENRLFRGNFIPVTPAGLPVPLVVGIFNSYVEMVAKHPTTRGTIALLELWHPNKWSSVPSDATAFVHRSPTYNLMLVMHWADDSFTPQGADAARVLDDAFMSYRNQHFAPELVGQGGYTNYLDEESQMASKAVVNRRFGSNFPRLLEIKRKYDPDNLFSKWFQITQTPEA
ncbi:hypothetical protein FRC07_005006 [Ceratobasidium sp. 392]|nr:hypothetical protein FRC07_005006 [Ceratobasidium sp. 392]